MNCHPERSLPRLRQTESKDLRLLFNKLRTHHDGRRETQVGPSSSFIPLPCRDSSEPTPSPCFTLILAIHSRTGAPSLRIVLSNIGTFGDINPLIAIALEL